MKHLLCAKLCVAKHGTVEETAYWILESERPWLTSQLQHLTLGLNLLQPRFSHVLKQA